MANNPFQPAVRKRARDKVRQRAKQRLQDVVQERRSDDDAVGVTVRRRSDDLGDAFPNDWLEFGIIAVALVGVIGGVIALVHLMNQVP
jgi:hypothetical protein